MSKFFTWLDAKLIRRDWYKRWQAKRSRRRLSKSSVLAEREDNLVESYNPTGLIEKQNDAYLKLLEERRKKDLERAAEEVRIVNLTLECETEARKFPERTKEIFEANKNKKRYTEAMAFYEHTEEIAERLENERNAKKG